MNREHSAAWLGSDSDGPDGQAAEVEWLLERAESTAWPAAILLQAPIYWC